MTKIETPAEFFERIGSELPGSAEGQALKEVGGVVEFEMEGNKTGEESTFFTFDLDETLVVPGTAEAAGKQPQVLVRARGLDFMALVEGRMSASDGLLTQRLHIAGDMTRLTTLLGVLNLAGNAQAA